MQNIEHANMVASQVPCDSYGLVNLHDYQKFAHDFIVTHPYAGLFLDMGMGKTLTTLSALYDINPSGHVLVIAPVNIARSTWLEEIRKWNLPLRTKSLVVNDNDKKLTKQKRHAIYEDAKTAPPTVYFINRELVGDIVGYFEKDWIFPFVILDEAQSFKSYTSARFKALKKVRPQIRRLVELTGTPSPNGLMDLWSQIYLLDQGERLGRTITEYRNAYFIPGLVMNGYPVQWKPKPGAEDAIYSRISDIVISMKNTALRLPPLTFNNVKVYMEPDELKLYKEMKKEFMLTFENGDDDDPTEVIAANAAVLSAKLRQMASGALYTDEEHNYKIIHRRKLEHVAYLLRSTSTPVLIAYHFHTDRIMLETYLTALGFEPQVFDGSTAMYRAWNAGKIPIMMLHPASAGHGLNFQDGGHTLIWYTMPWSLEEYLQTNARVYRQGQKEPVVIHHILTANTIDERVLGALEKKDMSQARLIEAVLAEVD